jgi:hypothetical protein
LRIKGFDQFKTADAPQGLWQRPWQKRPQGSLTFSPRPAETMNARQHDLTTRVGMESGRFSEKLVQFVHSSRPIEHFRDHHVTREITSITHPDATLRQIKRFLDLPGMMGFQGRMDH